MLQTDSRRYRICLWMRVEISKFTTFQNLNCYHHVAAYKAAWISLWVLWWTWMTNQMTLKNQEDLISTRFYWKTITIWKCWRRRLRQFRSRFQVACNSNWNMKRRLHMHRQSISESKSTCFACTSSRGHSTVADNGQRQLKLGISPSTKEYCAVTSSPGYKTFL